MSEVSSFNLAVHKQAVEFRNQKRKEYLEGNIPEEHKYLIEQWDIIKDENGNYFWNTKDLKEEPLSIDVFNKFIEEKKW